MADPYRAPYVREPSTKESGSFTYTTVFGTDETDISALFTTALTGTTKRKYSVFLDLTDIAADAAAWTVLAIRVKVKVDGTNYRTVDKKTYAKADLASGEEPGVPIDIPAVAQDCQITFKLDVGLGANQSVPYSYVKEVLE